MKKDKIYPNLDAWYHPEIDYWEMIENFKYTKDPLREAIGYKPSVLIHGSPYPLTHATLMFHAKAFNYDKEKKREYPSKQQMFQFWNKQFNNAFEELLRKLDAKIILDAGAGDGMLSKILHDRGFNVIAIDSYKWPFEKKYFPIRKMGYKKALKKFKPDVVICSWMPPNTDWTPDFRATKSVKHYILIGEVEAACGGNWKDRKGWKMRLDAESSTFALCRTDDLWYESHNSNKPKLDWMMHHSSVYLFSKDD